MIFAINCPMMLYLTRIQRTPKDLREHPPLQRRQTVGKHTKELTALGTASELRVEPGQIASQDSYSAQ